MVDIQYGIIIMGGREISRPYWVGFSPKASGFYPWGNVDSPRKRVAEGLCGWRHGNSFPMTQSAQSHRQMRSIPHCSKAFFYVFVLDTLTIRQHCIIYAPRNFPLNPLKSYLHRLLMPCVHQSNWSTLTANQLSPSQTNGGGICVCLLWGWGVGGL